MHGVWKAQQQAQLLHLRGQDTQHKHSLYVLCVWHFSAYDAKLSAAALAEEA